MCFLYFIFFFISVICKKWLLSCRFTSGRERLHSFFVPRPEIILHAYLYPKLDGWCRPKNLRLKSFLKKLGFAPGATVSSQLGHNLVPRAFSLGQTGGKKVVIYVSFILTKPELFQHDTMAHEGERYCHGSAIKIIDHRAGQSWWFFDHVFSETVYILNS